MSKRTVQRKLNEEGFQKRGVRKSLRIHAANVKQIACMVLIGQVQNCGRFLEKGHYIVINVR